MCIKLLFFKLSFYSDLLSCILTTNLCGGIPNSKKALQTFSSNSSQFYFSNVSAYMSVTKQYNTYL